MPMLDSEGYELTKELLMNYYRLYSTIWWDQPPLHPGILQAVAALLGSGVQSFRFVAGLLCSAFLWALAACASPLPRCGFLAAICDRHSSSAGSSVADPRYRYSAGGGGFLAPSSAAVLCVSSVGLLSHGLSVTIMLPALGFGLGAVWLWQRFRLGGNRWVLFGSGIVFGLGFQTKFTVLLLLPALVVEFIHLAWSISVVRPLSERPCPPSDEEAARSAALPEVSVRAMKKIRPALGFLRQWSGIWLAGFAYGVALVCAFFPEEDLVWLLKYHFRPEVTVPFEAQAGLSSMLRKLGLDWSIAGFAALGLFLGLVQRQWAVVFPTVFFATSFLAHTWYRPWWDYYYLHLSLPMAWLGALGVQWTWDTLTANAARGKRNVESAQASLAPAGGEGLRVRGQVDDLAEAPSFRPSPPVEAKDEGMGKGDGGHRSPLQGWRLREFWPGWRAAGLIAAFSFCLAGFLVELPERWQRETAFLRAKPSPTEVKVLAQLKERRADTRWLYTDRPIWCAHASILIPPELAVLSLKRIASGDITHAEFLRLLYHYRPEQIVLQRRHFEDEKFHEFLRAFYDVVIEEGNLKYLVRRDWEAARKQRAGGEAGSQESEVSRGTIRLLTSAATVGGRSE